MPILSERIRRLVKSSDMYAILFLVAWPFLLYWPVSIGQKVFSEGDILWFFLPVRTELGRAVAEGRLPLWTPSLQAGFPLFAEGQVAALYPLNILFHLLLPPEFALSYTILFNLAWALLGMYVLVRSSGFRVASALLAGLVFGASGFMTSHIPHASLVAVATWLPWLIFFQQKYWQAKLRGARTSAWFLLISIGIGLQLLGGYPPIAFLNLGTFILFGVSSPILWVRLPSKPEENWISNSLEQFPRAVLLTILQVALGVGIAGIQLLPLAEFIGLSARGQEVGMAFFTSYSLEPFSLTQFLSPFLYLGQPNAANMEFWAYIGVLPFLLALLAPLLRHDIRTWVFFVLGLIFLSLALGGFNPVYEWLYYVPVFNRFRAPARFLFLFTFAAAFLAATSFEELQSRFPDLPRRNWRLMVTISVFIVVTLLIVILAYNQPPEFWTDAWKLVPGLLVLLSIGLVLSAKRRLQSQITFSLCVVGLTMFDLGTFSAVFLSTLTRMTVPSDLVQVPRTVQAMENNRNDYRVFVDKFPSVTQAAVRATLWPDLSLQYGKQGVGIYAPLESQRIKEYVDEMPLPMLNLMNVRYYLLPLETAPPGEESPFDESEPNGGLTLNVLGSQPQIPPTRAAQVEITSYTDQTGDLPDGFLAGELVLRLSSGEDQVLPMRLGIETGDWAYDALASLGKASHSKPVESEPFPAYLSSVGHEFQGRKYVARYTLKPESGPAIVNAIGVRSFLPGSGLTIEHIDLIDADGRAVSLASLLHRNDLALAFRSHTAAMWENRDVLPRAFMVHAAEVVKDEQALARMRQPDFQPAQVVLLSDDQAIDTATDSGQSNGKDVVAITDYKAERVVVKVKAESAGYLVLTDSWYPGWEATVDGRSTPIYRADYIFRAVRLQAGQHTIVFEYHPWSFAIGAAISGASLLICAGLAVFAYRRSKRADSIAPSLSA